MPNPQIQIISNSVENTKALGEFIGRSLTSATRLFLIGDLGSGKTAFVQGLAKGLEVPEKCYITSPTYTLVNEYPGRIPIYHVDLYRLNDPDDFEDIGFYDMLSDTQHIVAIEWADRIPKDYYEYNYSIIFSILDDNSRSITVNTTAPENNGLLETIVQNMNRPF